MEHRLDAPAIISPLLSPSVPVPVYQYSSALALSRAAYENIATLGFHHKYQRIVRHGM